MPSPTTRHFALTAVGRDRPGIVAAVSAVLLRHGLNIEDSQMTILRGHFTMMLVISAAADVDADALRADLQQTGSELALEAIVLGELHDLEAGSDPEPSHIVTVYGIDHPGIVHAVTAALAEREVDITDLETRLAGAEERPIYALMMEVALPRDSDAAELADALAAVGSEQEVDISVRKLDTDVL